jgi:hypothetical protein
MNGMANARSIKLFFNMPVDYIDGCEGRLFGF